MACVYKIMKKVLFLLPFIVAVVLVSAMPITLNLSFHRNLAIKILSINGIPTDSFSFKSDEKENLTIVAQVLYNGHTPVKNAEVTIYGYGGIDSNKTGKHGVVELHLSIDTIWRKDTPENYLSAIIVKGNQFKVVDKAVKIIYVK